ncbi:MAG: DNA internalization-related competence protein ComEC/Rec2 [Myxococcota bacterium]
MAAGILLADRGWLNPVASLAIGSLALAAGLLFQRSATLRAAWSILLFAAAGSLALGLRVQMARADRPLRPFDANLEGRVCAVERGSQWIAIELCEVVPVEVGVGSARIPRRVRISAKRRERAGDWLETLLVGQRIRARLGLRAPRSLRNPGAVGSEQRLARRGVGAVARLVDSALAVRVTSRDRPRPLAALERKRRGIGLRLHEAGPGGALLAALALGDRSYIGNDDREAFVRLGVAHLLAVSGLHLALVAGLAYRLLLFGLVRVSRLAERTDVRRLAFAGALAAALAYALLCGWGVPVRRALVFVFALALALARGRRTGRGHVLSAAAIVILAAEPEALFSLGAQLSFAASAGLLMAVREPIGTRTPRPGVLRRGLAALRVVLRSSASAIAVTAPVLAWHGLPVGPFGLVSNLVLVPWTALVLLPASLLAALVGGALPSPILVVAESVARGTLLAVAAVAAQTPPLASGRIVSDWVLFVSGVLALVSLRVRGSGARVALALMITALLRLAPQAVFPPPPPRVVSLDVGQGDATLVQGRSAAILVDAGSARSGGPDLGRRAVLPALAALGIERLDLLAASHADLDHRGGLPAVIEELPVARVWLPLGAHDEVAFQTLLEAARDRGVPVFERGAGDPPLRIGDLEIQSLWPERGAGVVGRAASNDRSLVLRIGIGERHVLLAGDVSTAVERVLLEGAMALDADVLKLGHHGSRSSSSAAFLAAVGANIALLSVPCGGRAGLPSVAVLERVRAAQQTLWWTGRDGAIFVGLGAPFTVWGWGPTRRCPTP